MSNEHPTCVAEARANPSNHIACRACWNRWLDANDANRRARGQPVYRRSEPAGFRSFMIDGPCCYCGGESTDGVPYGTGNERREICGGDHSRWTGRPTGKR